MAEATTRGARRQSLRTAGASAASKSLGAPSEQSYRRAPTFCEHTQKYI